MTVPPRRAAPPDNLPDNRLGPSRRPSRTKRPGSPGRPSRTKRPGSPGRPPRGSQQRLPRPHRWTCPRPFRWTFPPAAGAGTPPPPPYLGPSFGPSFGPTPPPAGSQPGNFFDWIRRQGVRRGRERWVGGVASGIAERFGVDPLIVRGILIVLTVFAA
ncbi:PspC domain-containing protein [Pseudarthrobacter sp. So.54]